MKAILLYTTTALTLLAAVEARAQTAAATPRGQQEAGTASAPGPADDAATQATAGEPVAQPSEAGDIIVTAQRRSESLQHAALAISAISGDALARANITEPTGLGNLVPALQIAPSNGPFPQFYLRGVGNFAGNALSEAAVAFNVDGLYIARPSSTSGFLYDLDRVEVLKGPQGTLYGRNATGGAINVITHKPELGAYGGRVSLQYGNYDAIRAEAAANIPIGDDVALRAAGVVMRHDGYMQDGTDNQDERGARLLLRARPTPDLTIDLGADYFKQDGRGVGADPLFAGADLSRRTGLQSAAGTAVLTATPLAPLGRTLSPLTFDSFLDNEYWGINGTIDYASAIGTFTVVPGYRKARLNFFGAAAGYQVGATGEQDEQTSIEARYASDETKPLRVLVGGYYLKQANHVPEFVVNQQFNFNLYSYTTHSETAAGFGRLTFAPVPQLRFTAAGRYTTETKTLDSRYISVTRICTRPSSYFPTYTPGCPAAQPIPYSTRGALPPVFVPGADGTITLPSSVDNSGPGARQLNANRFTYRLAADWDVTPTNLLYLSYETGFKAGGFYNTIDEGVYRPESIRAFTLGSKNTFFNGRVTLNVEAFYWKYRDQQQTALILDSHGSVVFATLNVGRSTNKGVEVEFRYAPTRFTSLSADVQYLDAVYDSYSFQTPNTNGGVSNGTGCANGAPPGSLYTVDCSGKRPQNAPAWTINVAAQQKIALNDGAAINLSTNARYQSRTLTGAEFLSFEYQPAFWRADAQIGYTTADKRLTLGAFVNNIFDKTVLAGSQPIAGTQIGAGVLAPPRTYGVRLSASF